MQKQRVEDSEEEYTTEDNSSKSYQTTENDTSEDGESSSSEYTYTTETDEKQISSSEIRSGSLSNQRYSSFEDNEESDNENVGEGNNEDDEEYETDSEYDTESYDEDGEADNQIREMFNLFDEDKNGYISPDELGLAMRAYGLDPSQAEIEEIVSKVDKDKNGQIDFAEFRRLMRNNLDFQLGYHQEDLLKDILESFSVFAEDNRNGNITTEKFGYILEMLDSRNGGLGLDKIEIQKIVKMADQNADGEIDLNELTLILSRNNNELLNKIVQRLKPSPIDYLNAFLSLPKSFRPSQLHQTMTKGIHIASNYLKPPLAENGLVFQDLQIEAKDATLKPCYPPTYRINCLVAKGIPLLGTFEILERRLYLALHDGSNYRSNVFYLTAQYSDTREDEWAFGTSDPLNSIIVRSACIDPNLSILIELVAVVRKQKSKSGKHNCISCGWTKLDINSLNKDYNLPRNYELVVKGGTLTAPTQIDRKDIKAGRKGIAGKLELAVKGLPNPQFNIRVVSIVKPDEQRKYAYCPPNIIMSDDSRQSLSLYRKILSHETLHKTILDDKMRDQINPALRWFPKLLDDLEIWRGFLLIWHKTSYQIKGSKKRKKNDVQLYSEEFMRTVSLYYPILFALDLPSCQFGSVVEGRAIRIRENYITKYRENMMEALTSDAIFAPFDARETVYSVFD